MMFQRKVELREPIARGCHQSSKKPIAGDERAGDGRVEESSEKEQMEGGSTE